LSDPPPGTGPHVDLFFLLWGLKKVLEGGFQKIGEGMA
jgi:hypothetical protein